MASSATGIHTSKPMNAARPGFFLHGVTLLPADTPDGKLDEAAVRGKRIPCGTISTPHSRAP